MKHNKFEDEEDNQGQSSIQIPRPKRQSIEIPPRKRAYTINKTGIGQVEGLNVDSGIVSSFTKIKQQRSLQHIASVQAQSLIKNQFMERGADISVGHDEKSKAFIRKLSIKPDDEIIQELMQQDKNDPFSQFDEHRIPLPQLMLRLQTDPNQGLTDKEAQKRNLLLGDNKLTEKKKQPWWVRLLLEMTNPFAIMLWVGAALCIMAYILQPVDTSNIYLGLILIFVVVITGLITYQQTAKSEALMESFKNFLPQTCNVIRDGSKRVVAGEKLVCGDIIEIRLGDKVPADIRILQSREMKVDNSCLTGESDPQLRSADCTHPNNLLETKNLAFFGTLVIEGTGKGVVVKIGDATVLGQIANLASSSATPKSPLRIELDRFVVLITIIAVVLGILFFLCAWLIVEYDVLQCIIFGIGILVANVPEGLLGCITISLAITAKRLSLKQVLVKNLEAVETLGSTSCICSDKTGTLTQNKMTVENIWYSLQKRKAHNQEKQGKNFQYEYDTADSTFKCFQECAVITSEAVFDLSGVNIHTTEGTSQSIKYLNVPVIGDATETALIKFFQPIEDITITRSKRKCHLLEDDSPAKMTFNSINKYALVVVEHTTDDSIFCVQVKGAPERVWSLCNKIMVNGKISEIDENIQRQFEMVNDSFANNGERVLGFAKFHLNKANFKPGFKFNVNSPDQFNFPLVGYTFVGLISVIDPPKDTVPFAVLKCQSAGIKVIMVTGDQPATAAAIARQVNIITEKTVDEVAQEQGISWEDAYDKANAIVIHGDKITRAMEQELLSGIKEEEQDKQLMKWCMKKQIVFARTSPAQKLKIVQACQKLGYIVAVTGDGVNDSPAIKQADIGISMGISGSDVTQDAADMILLNDDFASIVDGIEEGRKIFDNLKKTIVYLLTSNCTEIIPFIAMVLFGLPLPLSSVFMLVICVGTDILPALSLAYEDAEMDIMTRKPRTRSEHLVSQKLLVHSYLLMGWIATSAGFMAYFTTMEGLGFSPLGLIGLNNKSGFSPVSGEDVFAFDASSPVLGNSNLNLSKHLYQNNVCTPDLVLNEFIPAQPIDWLWITQADWDLRNVIVKCGECSVDQLSSGYKGQYCYQPVFTYQECTYKATSPITNKSACYTTESLKYGQSSYFVAVVVVQWSNIFACKSRKSSFIYSIYNKVMVWGIFVETLIAFGICYTPGVQLVFGGRPLSFSYFGIPGLPYSMMLLLWEESRKFLIRNVQPNKIGQPNWFEKNSLW